MFSTYHAIAVFVAQIIFNVLKVLEIKYTYQNKINLLMMNSIWIGLVGLLSTYYAIDDLLKGNIIIVFFYISGSVIGKWVGMKIKISN